MVEEFHQPESPSLSLVIDPSFHTDDRRVVRRSSAFKLESVGNSALEAMDSVKVGNSLSTPMDSFQLGEEKNERGTGVVVYFRTYSERCSREESIHWYALSIEDPSNPNPSPTSENNDYCLPDYPTPPKILQPFSKTYQSVTSCAVGLGSSIYVIGGRPYVEGIGEIYASNKVYKYDTADLNPEWKEVCSMQRERAQLFSAAVLDGKIYVQGGLNVEETELEERDSGWVEYLDPEIGRWQILPPVKIDGKDKSLHRILNPNCEHYFICTMTPLRPDKLVFSSNKSPSPSYVYNIRDGSLVEMVSEKDFIKFHIYEDPVVLGSRRYYVDLSTGALFGYCFNKFTWATNSHTPVFLEHEYPRDCRVCSLHINPRVDSSSIGNQCYFIWVRHFHNSYYEIRCKPIVVSHDIETSADNSEAPFEPLDVRIKPSICQFISAGDNLLDGLVLDKVVEKEMVEGSRLIDD